MDANVSTMTMPKTMPAQNLLRYLSVPNTVCHGEALLGLVTSKVIIENSRGGRFLWNSNWAGFGPDGFNCVLLH